MKRSNGPRSFGSVLVLMLVGLAFFAAGPTRADEESGWRLRVQLVVVDPSDDTWRSTSGGGFARTDFDTGGGVGIHGEYQFTPRIGIDFGVLNTASIDVEASSAGAATVDVDTFTPFTVGADFHLTPGKRADLYIGPQLAVVQYDEIFVSAGPGSAGSTVSIDTDLGVGAILGLDVPFGDKRHWAFVTSLRYLATSMEGTSGVDSIDVDFDPVIFGVGFGYRW